MRGVSTLGPCIKGRGVYRYRGVSITWGVSKRQAYTQCTPYARVLACIHNRMGGTGRDYEKGRVYTSGLVYYDSKLEYSGVLQIIQPLLRPFLFYFWAWSKYGIRFLVKRTALYINPVA